MRAFLKVMMAVMLLAMHPAVGLAVDYTVRNLPVSATAEDATTARMVAMTQAENAAYARILEQLLPPEQAAARAASAPPGGISSLVSGYDVRNEKISARSYSAEFDVSFNPARLSAFLNQGGAANTTAPTVSAPTSYGHATSSTSYTLKRPGTAPSSAVTSNPVVLLLPAYEKNGKLQLWESENIWREAWNGVQRADSQSLRLPIGDQSDKLVLADARQATSFGQVSTLAERYQAGSVILATASETVSTSGVKALQVTLSLMSADNSVARPSAHTFDLQPGEDTPQAMARVAQTIAQQLTQERQQGQQAASENKAAAVAQAGGAAGQITVLSKLNAAADWVQLRKRLMAVPSVARVQLSAISNQQADVVVHYRGSLTDLESAMAAQGFQVSKTPRYWIVAF